MIGSIPKIFERQRELIESVKKIVASGFFVSIDVYKKGAIVIAIARTRPSGPGPNDPPAWYRELGERIAARDEASFLVSVYEEGRLIYDGFAWDADFTSDCDTDRYIAAIKNFMTGIQAARAVNPDQAVNDVRLKAALEAVRLPEDKSVKKVRGDFL